MKKTKVLSILLIILIAFFTSTLNIGVCYASENGSESYYLYDYHSGTEIQAKNENKRLQIASMTKIMLLLLCFDNLSSGKYSIEDKVPVSNNAMSMGGSQVFLEAGGEYTANDLIKSIVVASANDSSVAMAEFLYGSEENCVQEMNKKAELLGLKNTLFCNVTGLPQPMQYSSAKDIAIIFSNLIKHKEYYNYSTIWMDKIDHKNNSTEISNTNKLIKFYEGCDGGKTGFTNEAGFCLTATAKRGNMRLIASVLNAKTSKERFNQASTLLNYGFNNYSNKVVVDKDICLEEKVNVIGGKINQIEVAPVKDFYVFSKRNSSDNIEIEKTFNKVKAPINVGDKVGEIIVYKDGIEIGKVNIISKTKVEKSSYFDNLLDIIKEW